MAQTVKIISDSTCDLSKDLLEKYDISILPLHILLGRQSIVMVWTLPRKRSSDGPMKIRPHRRPLRLP